MLKFLMTTAAIIGETPLPEVNGVAGGGGGYRRARTRCQQCPFSQDPVASQQKVGKRRRRHQLCAADRKEYIN